MARAAILRLALAATLAVAPDLAAQAQDAGPDVSPVAIEAVFLDGMRALDAGDPGTAIRRFRAILARRPDLPRVRLELARAQIAAGEFEQARDNLFAVLSGDLPPEVRENVIRLIRAIDARRGFDWSLDVSLGFADDAGRTYRGDTVVLDVLGAPLPFTFQRETRDGIEVTIDGDAEFRAPIGLVLPGGGGASAFASGFARLTEGETLPQRDRVAGVRAGMRGVWDRSTGSIGVSAQAREVGGEHAEDRLLAEVFAETRTPDGYSFAASGFGGWFKDRLEIGRSGPEAGLRLLAARSLGGRSAVGVIGDVQRLNADAEHQARTLLRGEVFGRADIGFGLDARLSVFALRERWDGPAPLFVDTRDETEYGADLRLAKRDLFLLGRFTPYVETGVSRRDSSIDAFAYDEVRFSIGVERAF